MADRPIAFLLPGQGAQYAGMACRLYASEPRFAEVLDEFFRLLGAEGTRLRDSWLNGSAEDDLDDGAAAQPLLFGIDYAVGRLLLERGLLPAALVGHSVGELAAAALAGVFDLPAAARILAARSRVLAAAPPGGMLAVAADPDTALRHVRAEWADGGVAVGAVNGPGQTILSGPDAELGRTESALREAGITARRVRSAQPFHSPVMASAATLFQEAFEAERLRPPRIPIMSTRTVGWVEPDEACSPEFWAGQMMRPVRFWQALREVAADKAFTMLETGPGASLSTPARRLPSVRAGRSGVLALVTPKRAGESWSAWEPDLAELGLSAVPPEPIH